jgi:hypothetical protein
MKKALLSLALAVLAGLVASGCGSGTVSGPAAGGAAAGGQPAAAPAGAANRGQASAVYTKQAPAIDGMAAGPAWQQCPPLTLGRIDGAAIGDLKTAAFILLDDKNLYVAWQCDDKNTAALAANATARDEEVWKDDSVELFVCSDGKTAYQFVVNSKGALLDGKGPVDGTADRSWNSSATAKADIQKGKGWSVTLSIPLKDLGVKSGKGQTWVLNLYRTKPTADGYVELSWSAKGTSQYSDSAGWGKLVGVNVP